MLPTIKAKNIYYFHSILEIGGIETFFYYLAKKYKDWDLVVVYTIGNDKQIKRLSQYVKCVKYEGQKIECDRAFFNFNTDIINNVTATDGYYLVIHGDYKDMIEHHQLDMENLPGHPKITKYIAVSQKACDSWTEITGKPCELCYNPFYPDKPKKKLKLISATRLSPEKGGKRILKLNAELEKRGIDFEWIVFSNRALKGGQYEKHLILKNSKLDIMNDIADADFLVQLSDNEGYCYSVVEALSLGVPVIVTPCPVLKEIGVNESNSITLNFDCSNIDEVIDKMLNKKFNFEYIPKKDRWDELLIPGESQYQKERHTRYEVSATRSYQEYSLKAKELGRIPKPGEHFLVTIDDYRQLSGNNKYGEEFVRFIKEIDIRDLDK